MLWIKKLRWYYLTRATGLFVFLYEVMVDTKSPDRATIIIAACGLMGLDKVARANDEKHDK